MFAAANERTNDSFASCFFCVSFLYSSHCFDYFFPFSRAIHFRFAFTRTLIYSSSSSRFGFTGSRLASLRRQIEEIQTEINGTKWSTEIVHSNHWKSDYVRWMNEKWSDKSRQTKAPFDVFFSFSLFWWRKKRRKNLSLESENGIVERQRQERNEK